MSGTSQYVKRWSFENGATPTFSGSSDAWDFLPGSNISKKQGFINSGGLTGTARTDVSRSRFAPYTVGGQLRSDAVSAAFLGTWLPRAFGGGTATSPALANAPLLFGALMEMEADVFNAKGCVVNAIEISSRAGGAVECMMDIIGLTHGQDVGTYVGAALGTTLAYEPFVHSDLGLTIASVARTVLNWRFRLNNGFRARMANSLSADAILRTDPGRVITFEAAVPCTSTEVSQLYGLSKDGAAASAVMTNGTCSGTLSFSRFQLPDNSPEDSDGEIILPLSAQIRGTSGGDELTATIDLTP